MASLSTLLLYVIACLHIMLPISNAEPVQYCKLGKAENPNAEINFCMGLAMHENLTSSSHDLLLTMSITRYNGSSRGWTAIGLGSKMADALMFIVYGDPTTHEDPIVSIRRASGHHQPSLISRSTIGGTDLRVLRAAWMPLESGVLAGNNTSYVARVELVCYSCTRWPGVSISATDNSQPWMWAWNPDQEFSVYTYDTHLTMHKHHAGAGGWGNFYVDMARSVNHAPTAPSFPPIRPYVDAVGASDTPQSVGGTLSMLITSPGWHAHGLVMGMAFMILFPAGLAALKSGSGKAVKYHWVLQLAASLTVALGVMLGFFLKKSVDTTHQKIGIAIAVCLGIQGLVGWQHHVIFLRIYRRTWLSYMHVWLGRLVMICGWGNLITGISLRNWSRSSVALAGVIGCLEILGLIFFVWYANRRKTRTSIPREIEKAMLERNITDNRYFQLEDDEAEEEEEDIGLGVAGDEDQGVPHKSK